MSQAAQSLGRRVLPTLWPPEAKDPGLSLPQSVFLVTQLMMDFPQPCRGWRMSRGLLGGGRAGVLMRTRTGSLAPGCCVRAGDSAGGGAGSEGEVRPCSSCLSPWPSPHRKPGSQPLCCPSRPGMALNPICGGANRGFQRFRPVTSLRWPRGAKLACPLSLPTSLSQASSATTSSAAHPRGGLTPLPLSLSVPQPSSPVLGEHPEKPTVCL